MKKISATALVASSLAISGCGAAQLAMKGPISNQCASTGLKGCPDLTDGVMEYVGGDKGLAEKKLRAAAAANSPEQLRVFASALEPIGSSIGGDAGAAMKAVAAILRNDTAGEAPAEKASASTASGGRRASATAGGRSTSSGSAAPSPQSPPPNVVVEELRAGTERPATDPRAAICGGIFGADPKCGRVRVFVGPLVVTNAYTSGGCADELFLTAGRLEKPHWILLNPAGAAMNVSGQFILEDGEELFAGVRASAATPKDDVKCAITWSGFRPVSASAKTWGRYLDD
jgi:hypothetical protein